MLNGQEMLQSPSLPLENTAVCVMERYESDFYDDCQNIPEPSALDPTQKNLLLLDDCFLGKQNKAEAYYTRGRHNNCDTINIAQKLLPSIMTYISGEFEWGRISIDSISPTCTI